MQRHVYATLYTTHFLVSVDYAKVAMQTRTYPVVNLLRKWHLIRSHFRWDQWNTNCSEPLVGGYASTLPVGARVPHWAYLQLLVRRFFIHP